MIGDAAIGKVVDGLTDAVDSVTRVAGKAVRDKDMAERNQNAELIALWEQYRAEFGNANKGGFDAFVDGMNRLVRPVTAFSVLGAFGFLLWYGTQNPEGLVRLAQAVALIPATFGSSPLQSLAFISGGAGPRTGGSMSRAQRRSWRPPHEYCKRETVSSGTIRRPRLASRAAMCQCITSRRKENVQKICLKASD
jgi:hypothetical protein